jgi:hypothetical protein
MRLVGNDAGVGRRSGERALSAGGGAGVRGCSVGGGAGMRAFSVGDGAFCAAAGGSYMETEEGWSVEVAAPSVEVDALTVEVKSSGAGASSGGAPGAAEDGGPGARWASRRRVPQLLQKFASARLIVRQRGHSIGSRMPHTSQ